ncbi:hypothetical protein EDB80DRAFT_729324 [Ilyonectria destructans]|nr:hypothetical protein EDB80DRAFT_729324 [Ilyonectria destructans]
MYVRQSPESLSRKGRHSLLQAFCHPTPPRLFVETLRGESLSFGHLLNRASAALKMSGHIPKSNLSQSRSGFAMIDPETELYSHKLGRAQHVAISYVWSEWKNTPQDALPDWQSLRSRLLELVGASSSSFMKIMTGHRKNCWLDSKCINQDSKEDKAYWIPRMDEIYSEARCTVLLTRGIDLGPLVEAEKLLACHVDHDDHVCLLTQSCSSIADWESIDETKLINIMQKLSQGTWRKRAWIFQEILLSREYILSGEASQIKLSDCGTLAGLLFRRNPGILWLGEFVDWCRRLYNLRRRYFLYTISIANVLQMAHPLEATVQADKYYALCGILRLKNFKYDGSHTADEALQAIILELTRRGHMSWLYAIRPALDPQQHGHLRLKQDALSEYFDHNLNQNGSFYAKPQVSSNTIGFRAFEVGDVHRVVPMSEFLQETVRHVTAQGPAFSAEQLYMQSFPRVLQKLAWETISPLLQQPCVDQLRSAFEMEEDAPTAELIWRLYTLDNPESFLSDNSQRVGMNYSFLQFAIKASWALKQQIMTVQDRFALVLWRKVQMKSVSARGAESTYEIAIGNPNIPCTAKVCSVVGDQGIMFAAEFPGVSSPVKAEWRGSLLPVWDLDSDKGTASKIFSQIKSRMTGKAPQARQLAFVLSS